MFTFVRCLRGIGVATRVKYEREILLVTGVLMILKNRETHEKKDSGFVTLTTGVGLLNHIHIFQVSQWLSWIWTWYSTCNRCLDNLKKNKNKNKQKKTHQNNGTDEFDLSRGGSEVWFVDFSVIGNFGLENLSVSKSRSYFLGASADQLRWHLSNIFVIFYR